MIVLDPNVVSELMRLAPSSTVVAWLDVQVGSQVDLTAITVAELAYGVARLPDDRPKRSLAITAEAMIEEDFDHRVVAFDETTAVHYGDIVAQRGANGRPISIADAQIAAICRCHKAALSTRNPADFAGTAISLINPWTVG